MMPHRAFGGETGGISLGGRADSVVFENFFLYNSPPRFAHPNTWIFEYSDVSGLFTS